jgi:hypothetical protein
MGGYGPSLRLTAGALDLSMGVNDLGDDAAPVRPEDHGGSGRR